MFVLYFHHFTPKNCPFLFREELNTTDERLHDSERHLMLREYIRCDHEHLHSVVCCLFLAFFPLGLQHVKGFEWTSNLKRQHWAFCSWDWMSISYSNGPRSVKSEKHDLVDCGVNKETWKSQHVYGYSLPHKRLI